MDSRLFFVGRQRVAPLRVDDLPQVARAIVGYTRRRTQLQTGRVADVGFVRFRTSGEADVLVLESDWRRIMPFVQGEDFNTQLAPAELTGQFGDRAGAFSEPVLDRADRKLYDRILGVLSGLFTQAYPTRPY